jgi:xanthine/CO dehydrogenase XdhC/CoxF family maturation factor
MNMSEMLPEIDTWRAQGKDVAVATVISVEGSAPRPIGARLAVTSEGEMAGSVSGGCVENAVVYEAQDVLKTGKPRVVRYGITDEMAWDVGLACGGTIEVFVEPVNDAIRREEN